MSQIRVRVTVETPTQFGHPPIEVGREGVITRHRGNAGNLWAVDFGNGLEVFMDPNHFEPIPPTPDLTLSDAPGLDWSVANGSGEVFAYLTPAHELHFGPGIIIDFGVSPPKVQLNGAPPDRAARAFWNAVHAVVGRPPMFSEASGQPKWAADFLDALAPETKKGPEGNPPGA